MFSAGIKKRRFDVREYHRMGEAGILNEDDRVELLDGEILDMTPIGKRHADCVNRLTRLLVHFAGDLYVVSVQNPIRIDETNEPQPDLALLKFKNNLYSNSHPGPEDVALLVEVSESSLAFDKDVKLPLYAQAGIPEIWIIDLEAGTVELHSSVAGGEAPPYTNVKRAGRNEVLRSEAAPGLTVLVNDILGQT